MIFTEQEREKLKKQADKPKPQEPRVPTVGDRVQKRLKGLQPKTLGERAWVHFFYNLPRSMREAALKLRREGLL